MTLRRRLAWILAGAILALAAPVRGQPPAPISTTTCPGAGCTLLGVQGQGTVGLQITGTFVGTISPTGALDGVNYVAVSCNPYGSTTAVTSMTTTGAWICTVAGLRQFKVAFTAYTSGTANISLATTQAKAGPSGGSGGGGGGGGTPGGSDTQIQFNNSGAFGGSANLTWDGTFALTGGQSVFNGFTATNASTAGESNGQFNFKQARGTLASPTVVSGTDGDSLGFINWYAYNGSTYKLTGEFGLNALPATPFPNVDGSVPSYFEFRWWGAAGDPGQSAYFLPSDADGKLSLQLYDQVEVLAVDIVLAGTTLVPVLEFRQSGTTTLADIKSATVTLGNAGALQGDTTSGHTYLFNVYDTNTGPGYVTWGTVTGGNTPAVAIAPPAGGTTIRVTANYSTAAGDAGTLAVANVGANSCGTTAATIAGNNNAFEITVGATAGTQCRVAFTRTATNRWDCVATDSTTTIATRATYVDTTHVDFLGAFVAGDVVTGVCFDR